MDFSLHTRATAAYQPAELLPRGLRLHPHASRRLGVRRPGWAGLGWPPPLCPLRLPRRGNLLSPTALLKRLHPRHCVAPRRRDSTSAPAPPLLLLLPSLPQLGAQPLLPLPRLPPRPLLFRLAGYN
eukprot:scaffold4636_cov81-Isochrysis_galbana.AAC.2